MLDDVRLLDDLCARGWPAVEVEEADGWILRASSGVSLRANSVWPRAAVGPGDLSRRIAHAERFYAERGLKPRFQLSPASEPADLELELARRGYAAHTSTDVMTRFGGPRTSRPTGATLTASIGDGDDVAEVELLARAGDEWCEVMVDSATDTADARGRLAIIESIRLRRRHALIRCAGEPAAIGLGVADGAWAGIFAMRTLPRFRRRGLARQIVAALLRWAAGKGARDAYLQVETDNEGAIALYRGLGFTRRYRYRYLSPSLSDR